MSDVTFGVKMPEELKNQINKLMSDSGLVGKDFMQQLTNMYVVEKTRESIPEVAEDLKELQALTQRINNIYLNLGNRIENITKVQQEHAQKELQGKDNIILDLQSKIEALNDENDTLNNDYKNIVNQNIQLNQHVNELTDSNNNIKILNNEYKDKIDTMAGIVEQYKGYKSENDTLKSQLKETQDELQLKKTQLDHKTDDNEKLNQMIIQVRKEDKEEIASLKEKNKTLMQELENKHKDEIETVKDKASIEKDKAVLELSKTHQFELQDQQHKHNEEIEKYQSKIKDLLSEIENFKKVSSKEVKTKSEKK